MPIPETYDYEEWSNSLHNINYMRAQDIKQGDVVTITDVNEDMVVNLNDRNGPKVPALIIEFSGGYKPYTLRNNVNNNMLRAFFGHPSNWPGQEVELYTEMTATGLGIRFRLPQGSTSPKS